jgi:xanthine dehydrogenase YagR molybdenum-binding subunit
VEIVVNWANMLYPAENTLLEHEIVPLDVYSPLDMRAPGGSTGMHAVEVTMDEIAYQLNIDPLELRLINYSEIDKSSDKNIRVRNFEKCYLQGGKNLAGIREILNPEA